MTRAVAASLACACFLAACGDKTTEASHDTGRVALDVVVGPGPSIVLDSGRVHLDGPTPRELSATPGSQVTIDGLNPGSYTITLEGFAGTEVERFGRTAGVQVVAGDTTSATVTLNLFQPVLDPVTLSDDGLNILTSFPAVPAADSYQVEVDSTDAFLTPTGQTLTGTSVSFPIQWLGPHFLRARAFDPYDVPGTRSAPKRVTVLTLLSVAALDGFVATSGQVSVNDVVAFAGDDLSALLARAFFSFDISPIAPAEVVTGAVLRLFQSAIQGEPYTTLGELVVDHLDYGPALDAADFGLASLTDNIGTISTTPDFEFKTLPVTDAVLADRTAGRLSSQFRMRFSVDGDDGDAANDFVSLFTAEKGDTIPELRVVSE